MTPEELLAFLDDQNIAWTRVDHPAVFTCEEAQRLVPRLNAADTKNLFLKDKKGRRHFLVAVGYHKSVDLKALAKLLGVNKLGMASPDRLLERLGVEPGSVTLLALINDPDGAVEVIVDQELWEHQTFACHPLVNTATLVLSKQGLETFFSATGHQIQVVNTPQRTLPEKES